ncbi:hypothetical protein PVL29_017646 [Vitis rotundifolia]|uniref:Polygalacturonase n=1 Tax=Vitis rotundifolia TaxID=103349 RepID=A0AA39DIR2_VITRO|nr:hypothetical protein PVL29_017646 [Vitis rotundifolia]
MEYEAEIVDSTRYDQLGTPATSLGEVNVENFGAKGDGVTDDTEAFKTAWEETCSSNTAVLVPITFSGPCKSDSVKLKILGTIKASEDPSDYAKDRSRWLLFHNIKNFQVEGQGTIDGNGKIWWKNSCKINITQPCTMAPTAVSFVQCDNLKVYGLNVQNAQQMHVTFEESMNVQASNIMSEARVSNVMVNTAKLIGTTNGVRIKTWQGGSGYAENIVFQDIKMENVSNPIIIDQNYCDQETPCKEQNSAVQIRNIVYKNITGTSATKMTTIFNCSKTLPCQGIVQKDINLVYKAN